MRLSVKMLRELGLITTMDYRRCYISKVSPDDVEGRTLETTTITSSVTIDIVTTFPPTLQPS